MQPRLQLFLGVLALNKFQYAILESTDLSRGKGDASLKCEDPNECGDGNKKDCSNGQADCELPHPLCPADTFTCSEHTATDNNCIPLVWRCDGEYNCLDGSDEQNCDTYLLTSMSHTVESTYFVCTEGWLIPRTWVCDGRDDCTDGSDESRETCSGVRSRNTCDGNIHFKCRISGRCIAKRWVCDGSQDCDDNSDEENCEDRCAIIEDPFVCMDGSCVHSSSTCDGKVDCPDGSDESSFCNTSCEKTHCAHHCTPSAVNEVGTCDCRSGFNLTDDGTNCQDVDECRVFGSCSQKCHNLRGSFACSCLAGYVREGNRCTAQKYNETVMFVVGESKMFSLNVNTGDVIDTFTENIRNSFTMDYDWKTESIISSNMHYKLFAFRNNTIIGLNDITNVIKFVEGVAVDHVTGNVYILDIGEEKSRIIVCQFFFVSNEATSCVLLITFPVIHKLTNIAVWGEGGLLFYSDWGIKSHIGQMGTDGSMPRSIIRHNTKSPSGLTVDAVLNKIFWSDNELGSIECADFDGSNRVIVIRNAAIHAHSMAVFQDRIYWSELDSNDIESCNKFNCTDHRIIYKANDISYKPLAIFIYNPILKPSVAINPCDFANCSYLCLSSLSSHGDTLKASCRCPDGFRIDPKDNITCLDNLNETIFGRAHGSQTSNPSKLGNGITDQSIITTRKNFVYISTPSHSYSAYTHRKICVIVSLIVVLCILLLSALAYFCLFSKKLQNKRRDTPVIMRFRNLAFSYAPFSGSDEPCSATPNTDIELNPEDKSGKTFKHLEFVNHPPMEPTEKFPLNLADQKFDKMEEVASIMGSKRYLET